MRLVYAQTKLDQAVDELARGSGELRDRLYSAYLHIHTLLPEHLPQGPLREALRKIHDRFTKRRPADSHEESVVAVLYGLDSRAASELAQEIQALRDQVRVRATSATSETIPASSAPASHPLRREATSSRSQILGVFGTTDGHTRKVSEFVALKLRESGHEVTLKHALEADADCNPAAFDLVWLAGSLHFARYQNALITFASQRHAALNAMPSALISVSLAAAGAYSAGAAQLQEAVERFADETQWRPGSVHHVAGAIRHVAFDYFRELASTLIMERRGDHVGLALDYDMTDYAALAEFAIGFAKQSPMFAA